MVAEFYSLVSLDVLQVVRSGKPRCPFYGFSSYGPALLDTQGNQCALITGSCSPCVREAHNLSIDLDKCHLYDLEQRMKFEISPENIQVFPKGLEPKEYPRGISFKEWYQAIMGRPLGSF